MKKIKIIPAIDDLIVQATKERSHYYTAKILKRCKSILMGISLCLYADKIQNGDNDLNVSITRIMDEL